MIRRKHHAEAESPAVAEAIYFAAPAAHQWMAASVEFRFVDEATLVHLPALYLDEVVHRDRRRDAERLVGAVEIFAAAARAKVIDDPFAAAAYEVPLPPPEELVAPGTSQWATATTVVEHPFRAYTIFRPRRRVDSVLQPTFWAYWDALVEMMITRDQIEEIVPLLENLRQQCSIYRQRGLRGTPPGMAPAEAMMGGASRRLRHRRRDEESA